MRGQGRITFRWSPDHSSVFLHRELRLLCQCAACVEEFTGRPLLDPEAVHDAIEPRAIELVGSYAVRITWSDGHATGIFPFAFILAHCTCPVCAG